MPTDKQIEYVRLSRGIPRAAAKNYLLSGGELEPDWEAKLQALQEAKAAEQKAVKESETFKPESK
jgi:hypothetical protein